MLSVDLYLTFEDGGKDLRHKFTREELKEGLLTKTIDLRDDGVAIADCVAQWWIVDSPTSPMEPNIPLLFPRRGTSVPEGDCRINADETEIKVTPPFNFDDVTITITEDALVNKGARLLLGRLSYPDLDKQLAFNNVQSSEWRVHVATPGPLVRKVRLQWSLSNGTSEVEEFEAAEPSILIDGLPKPDGAQDEIK
jgi:hypothetical protein